jgi:hypothetical protein
MIDWVVVRPEHAGILEAGARKALGAGALAVADVAVPISPKKPPARVLCAWPDGGTGRRAPRFPEVLADWADIYDVKLFRTPALAVLAEEISGLGADVLVASAELGLKETSLGWYAKGAIHAYEHTGSATVAWTPDEGLGRPATDSLLVAGGKGLAKLLGADKTAELLGRYEDANEAAGEVLLTRAFLRILGAEPPGMDQLAGIVAQVPVQRIAIR